MTTIPITSKTRADGRAPNEMRKVVITPNFTKHAEGSVLIDVGDTRVICTASVQEKVPPFLYRTGKGWVTAEWGVTAGNRRARYYKLTKSGRKQLEVELSQFQRVNEAILRVIQMA